MVLVRRGETDRAGGPFSPLARVDPTGSAGASLVEVAIVLAVTSCLIAISLPVLINGAEARRTRDAASFLAGQFRLARQRAVMTGHHVAIVFDDVSGEAGWRLCEDGDRDGLSRGDITSGKDRCQELAQPLSFRYPQVSIGYVPGVPSPDGEVGASPLRFGLTQMAVFTPTGTASTGTVAVRGPGANQFAVRVSGVTGRTRVLRFDPGRREWTE
ncbi:MAG: GspH/FimT family pseudopilin [Vicinamibacterales bacterium]